MGPHQRHDRVPDLGRRQIAAAGAHPVEHQRVDPVRVPRRDRGGQLTALRGPEQAETVGARRVGHRQRRGHLPVERQVDPVPVGQAAPGLVVADHGEPLRQPLDEAAKGNSSSCPRRWETQPESNNSGGPAPDVEYATRPAGVLQYMILGLTGPG